MAIYNYPQITEYSQNFTIEMIKNKNSLNLFSDASMRRVTYKNHATCYGSVAVFGDNIIDEMFRMNSECTVPAAEIRGIRCSLILALKHRHEFKIINIFSDSQIALFSLRDYMYNWKFNKATERYVLAANGKEAKNQEILIECLNMLNELRRTNIVNLFHQNGHVENGMASIKEALKCFKISNGIKGIIGYDVIRYISLYNNYVDNKSRSFIRTTNIYDNNYRDAMVVVPREGIYNYCKEFGR